MRCDWSLDTGATWGSTTDRLEKKRRRTIAETFTYRTVKDGKKSIRPLVYGRDAWEEHLGAILADHEIDPFAALVGIVTEAMGRQQAVAPAPYRYLQGRRQSADKMGVYQRCFSVAFKDALNRAASWMRLLSSSAGKGSASLRCSPICYRRPSPIGSAIA